MLNRLYRWFFGYHYYQYIKDPNSHLCLVERVEVDFLGKSYTPLCFCTEIVAKNKVKINNKLIGYKDE